MIVVSDTSPVTALLTGVILLARHRTIIPSARELLRRLDAETGIYLDVKAREDALKTVGE